MFSQNTNRRNQLEARYRPIVEEIVEQWAIGKPPNPSPAATSSKPSGYFRLTNWLLDYLMVHGEFPKGVHMMPEGRDRFGELEPSFPVDFDPLTEGRILTKP
ncbi:hypothetical protein BIU88_05775 [Chlorobaculum limnaeum]|uniref:Uncharacterized protein n=1 Tax=Chlorobaculum limnaeum TaxID=274537 RepID=A0A1D8D7T0_CHLLM|nr:hypothetical protein [Chlorobaculum limnaeum]AOS83699.1 hypothetical protein BIU88_05775 [Chlorobaculum limnaeum]